MGGSALLPRGRQGVDALLCAARGAAHGCVTSLRRCIARTIAARAAKGSELAG